MIPFIDLATQQARIRDKIEAGFGRVLDHGAYVMGPEVSAIETRLAEAAAGTATVREAVPITQST